MVEHDIPVQCCRCKNKHNESERVSKPDTKHRYLSHKVCPRCGARSYYDLRPMVAFCWASGLIEFGEVVPEGAIKIAHGPKANLKAAVEVLARHGYGASEGKLLVPGIPKATNQRAAGDALAGFLSNATKRRRRDGVVFTLCEVA